MLTKTRLSLAVLAALGLSCAGAFATTNSMPADPGKLQTMDIHNPFSPLSQPLAKQGRGQDDTHPEDVIDDGCDNHGDDTACLIGSAGATPLLAKQGRGQDDTHPEDVIDDGCDNHGDDLACV